MRKLVDHAYRVRHVTAYTLPFVPIAAWRAAAPWLLFLTLRRRGPALPRLWLLHYATDSRRFKSTLGDVVAWHATRGGRAARNAHGPLAANPWEPLPILIDQAPHVAQLAALGFLLA